MNTFPPPERFITKEQLDSWFTSKINYENTSEIREWEDEISISRSETDIFGTHPETC